MKVTWKYLQLPNTPQHQRDFQHDLEAMFLHLSGGYGSGKTHALVMKAFQLSYLNRPFRGGLMCPSFPDYKRDFLPAMEELLESHGLKDLVKYNKNDKTWIFPWSRGPLHVVTAEKQLKGPNWAYALINELTMIPFARYKEVMARVRIRGAKFPQVASCGTYEAEYPEYDDFFWDAPNKQSRLIIGSTRANAANLAEHYISMLEGAYDARQAAVYIDGERINLTGNLFYYAYDPKTNDVPGYKIPSYVIGFLISLDFNVNPFCATIWVRDGAGVVAVDEVHLSGSKGFDSNEMADALIARGYNGKNSTLYPDPAGQSRSTKGLPDLEQFRRKGFTEIRVKSSAPRMRQRQLNANNLLERAIVRVDPLKAPWTKKDLLKVKQDPVTLEKLKTDTSLTHHSDGMDYLLDIEFPWSGRKPVIEQSKLR